MKKLVAISLLFIYLCPAADLYQLFKVPLLVKHFTEHRQDNNNITLWQFFNIHYAMGNIRDADYEKDSKLPFKSHNNCVSVISSACVPTFHTYSVAPPGPISEQKKFLIEDDYLLTSFYSSIWQPPRV